MNRKASRRIGRSPGFTLIELMVVVVIIGIFAAVVIPALLSSKDRLLRKEEKASAPPPPAQTVAGKPLPLLQPDAPAPDTISADITIRLSATHHVRGLDVLTLFDADFSGEYRFASPYDSSGSTGDFTSTKRVDRVDRVDAVDAVDRVDRVDAVDRVGAVDRVDAVGAVGVAEGSSDGGPIALFFPFPEGTTRASDVALRIADASGEYEKRRDALYTLEGIAWQGRLPEGEELPVQVSYKAQGYERYIYEGPGAEQAEHLRIEMILEDLTAEFIPADALQPTSVQGDRLVWEFDDLITARRIMVDLPGSLSPVGRVIRFLRLAGLAVFLFGIGFIYLNDLVQPGRLDDFRLGHFLLLAITYSLFFAVFAALHLGQKIAPYPSLVLAALLSLPLLFFHVSRFWGKHFALTSMLPLAAFTLAIVVNGVYGGGWKIPVYIGLTVIAAGFFTLTYRTWIEKKRMHREEKARQRMQALQEAEAEKKEQERKNRQSAWRKGQLRKFESALERLEAESGRTKALIRRMHLLKAKMEDSERERITERLGGRIEALEKEAHGAEPLRMKLSGLSEIEDDAAFSAAGGEIRSEAERRRASLVDEDDLLEKEVGELEKRHERQKAAALKSKDEIHCLACGYGYPLTHFCPNCGVRSPKRISCDQCGEVYHLPVHLLDAHKADAMLHCLFCGHPHERVELDLSGEKRKTEAASSVNLSSEEGS